jgi:arylsulfatase
MRALAVVTVLAWVAAPSCGRPPERPNVLLITIDTLRADRLSVAGYPRPTTPNLDRLAAEGLRFTHAETPRAKTTPAIATIFTGLYPHDHGVRDLLVPIEKKTPLLSESLQRAGYATGAIVGNYVLEDRFSGFARGFDAWCEDLPDKDGVPPDDVPQRRARSMTDGALAALGLATAKPDAGPARSMVREGEPWFLWLHYMDPHGLYDPPAEHRIFHRETPDPIPPGAGSVAEYNVPPGCRTSDGRVDAALVRDLYDGEVHYVDAEIGRLLDALRAKGLLENTLVVVTADHGEEMLEHGDLSHARTLFDEILRVPLLLRIPGVAPRTIDAPVELIELAPTLLARLGVPADPRMQGRDLLADDWEEHVTIHEGVEAAVAGPKPGKRAAMRAARGRGVKLVVSMPFDHQLETVAQSEDALKLLKAGGYLEGGASSRGGFFDLRTDPGEQHDLSSADTLDPKLRSQLLELLRQLERAPAQPAASK